MNIIPNFNIILNNHPPEPNSIKIGSWLEKKESVIKHQTVRWVQAHHPYYHEALSNLVDNIQRITHKQFTSFLEKAVDQFNVQIGQADDKNYVVLVEPNKSNQWVAELALKYLKYQPSACLPLGEKQARDYVSYLDAIPEGTPLPERIVLFDDASYSGTQLTNHVKAIFAKYKEMIDHNSSIKMPTIHVIAPFSTKYAIKRLQSLEQFENGSLRLSIIAKIKNVKESLSQDHVDRLRELYDWPEDPMEVEGRGLCYFDHKIPNGMSFMEAFTKGSVFPGRNGHEAAVNKGVRFTNLPEIKPPYKN